MVGFGLFGALAQSAGAAPVVVNHVDPSGGFHSLDAPDPTSTAPGTTIGAQRRVCFEAAANNRAARLESDVAITVDADPGSALEGFVDSEAHLVCYRVRDDKALEQAKFERTDVAANNPFGGFGVRTNRPDRLCVPSTLSVR